MIRVAYKVIFLVGDQSFPEIVKVDISDPEGVSWRDAKKQLRQYYLSEAAALRAISEETYFK